MTSEMTAQEFLESYRRGSRYFRHINLRGADLRGAKLDGVKLVFAQLRDADLRDADLTGADLTAADLINANLKGSVLRDANLKLATLTVASLTDAKLGRADLSGANLSRATLQRADLSEANLCDANLVRADLARSNLGSANLTHADLKYADLTEADLTGANLSQARLIRTIIRSAVLGGSRFDQACCLETLWANVNLAHAKALDTIDHQGPSTVGIETLLLSEGKAPEKFLRGCGVPEHVIELQKSLIEALSPIQFYSCFISHSHEDEEFAKRLHGRLQQAGLRVWYAPEKIKAGRKLLEQIDEAIRVHDKLLLVLSPASMASEWVATEISKARKRERMEGRQVLFPIRLVDFAAIREWECFDADAGKDSAREIREYYVPDFSIWKDHDAFEIEFAKLLEALQASAA